MGLSVACLDEVMGRLSGAGTPFVRGSAAVGRNVYLNDPGGVPDVGMKIEIIEYLPDVRRSGASRSA